MKKITKLSGKTQMQVGNNGAISGSWLCWEIINDGKSLRVWGEQDNKVVIEDIYTARDGYTFDPNRVNYFSSYYNWNDSNESDCKNKKEVMVATLDVPIDSEYKDDCVFVTLRERDMKIININTGFIRSAFDMPCDLDPNYD